MNTATQEFNAAAFLADLRKQTANRKFTEADDAAFFAQPHAATAFDITVRQLIERAIIRRAVTDALQKGFVVSVWDGDEYTVTHSNDLAKIMAEVMAADEGVLAFWKPDASRKTGFAHLGAAYLVYGNDGWDVINNYHTSLEELLSGANALADSISNAI